MNDELNEYEITFKYFSTREGTTVRIYHVTANNFSDAEKKFDEMFDLLNNVADDVYGDDVVYEIINISKAVRESEVNDD